MTNWEIKGREFGNCNCSYGCPCQFKRCPPMATAGAWLCLISRKAFTVRPGSTD